MAGGRDSPHPVLTDVRKPQRAIRADRDAVGRAVPGYGELAYRAAGGDASDLAGAVLGEPERAVRACRDLSRCGAGRGNRCKRHRAGGGDAPDPVIAGPVDARSAGGEPQRAVSARGDSARARHPSDRELPYRSLGGDPPDLARVYLTEPERAVRAPGDVRSLGVIRGQRKLLHRARRGDATDLVAHEFGEPKGAVRPERDAFELLIGAVRDRKLGEPCRERRGGPHRYGDHYG